jgi:hypothetical protein
VRIVVDQPIRASAGDAQAGFLDPELYRSLGQLQGIAAPRVDELTSGPGWARMELHYRFSGELHGPARRILDPARLSWAQVTEVDLGARRTTVRMVPDNYGGLLSFSGWYELRESAPDECCQHFEADLRVHFPVLGALAERAIAGSIKANIAETAQLLERFVAGHRDV